MKGYLKKLGTVMLIMAMIMALCTTASAAPGDTDGAITVKGLAKEKTSVTVYKIVSLGANGNSWSVADGAEDAVDLTTEPVTIIPDKINVGALTAEKSGETGDGSITFNGLAQGAYLVMAASLVNGSTTTYNRMVGVTYRHNDSTEFIEGTEARITAKPAKITVSKEASTNFAGVGTELTFDVKTTFPSFHTPDGKDTSGTYQIVDTPSGMTLDTVESVKVGGEGEDSKLPPECYTVSADHTTVTFTESFIGETNVHAGQMAVVTYKGTVTDREKYNNKANAWKDGKNIGEGMIPPPYTGTIEFTKYGDDIALDEGTKEPVLDAEGKPTQGTKLPGAQFEVKHDGALLYFVKTGDGRYQQVADRNVAGAVSRVEVAGEDNDQTGAVLGTVSLTYLAAGAYEITEVVAPDGYTVLSTPVSVTVTGNEGANVTAYGFMTDTKLSALPSTGGIGTYLFTIIGVVLMAAAAGIFFLKRRRDAK